MIRYWEEKLSPSNQHLKQNKKGEIFLDKGLHAPCFILVRPQMAENIGMAARAMMNCGIFELRLVAPRESPTDEKALSASSGADVILHQARVFETLSEAVSDLTFLVATTARARDMEKKVLTAEETMPFLAQQIGNGEKVGILFGCERTGLLNDELALADNLLTIPLNPAHTSLNLSQAVLLIGYEWLKASRKPIIEIEQLQPLQASKEELIQLFERFDQVLNEYGYYRWPLKKPRMRRNLNNIFIKACLTKQEVRTLHGVLNTLTHK